MSFLKEAKKVMDEDGPFFRPEVLKEYKFQMVSARRLGKNDRLYDEKAPKWEFTLLDTENGKEKTWTTGGQVINDMIFFQIDEGDYFSVVKTGETGKGKKYWDIKKINPEQSVLGSTMGAAMPVTDKADEPLSEEPPF